MRRRCRGMWSRRCRRSGRFKGNSRLRTVFFWDVHVDKSKKERRTETLSQNGSNSPNKPPCREPSPIRSYLSSKRIDEPVRRECRERKVQLPGSVYHPQPMESCNPPKSFPNRPIRNRTTGAERFHEILPLASCQIRKSGNAYTYRDPTTCRSDEFEMVSQMPTEPA